MNLPDTKRLVLHLDLDCFYAQVEAVRLGISESQPLAVQQWDRVIAVNYAARRAGIVRHASAKECFAVCPTLNLVHLPVLSVKNPIDGPILFPAQDVTSYKGHPDRFSHKASLHPYRQASVRVFDEIRRFFRQEYKDVPFIMEKAGVDEAYLDITSIVNSILPNNIAYQYEGHPAIPEDGITIGVPCKTELNNEITQCTKSTITQENFYNNSFEPFESCSDRRLAIATVISNKLRSFIFNKTSYTISAGVSHNKILAKIGSALNKPNAQTYICPWHVDTLLKKVPVTRIRSLGGKLGGKMVNSLDSENNEADDDKILDEDETIDNDFGPLIGDSEFSEKESPSTQSKDILSVNEKNVEKMASDLQSLSIEELVKISGDTASALWLHGVVRGQDDSPVTPRTYTKSIMAAKQFRKPHLLDPSDIESFTMWIRLLCAEILNRLNEEYLANHRWPQSTIIYYRCVSQKSRRKSFNFTLRPKEALPGTILKLANSVMATLKSEFIFGIPHINGISLSATKFIVLRESAFLSSVISSKSRSLMELPEKMVAHGSFDSDLDQNQTFSKNNKHPLKDTKSNSISLEEVSNSLKRKANECTGSQNEQKKTIKDYFKRLDPQASTEPCPECGNPILLSKLTEHQDFHLALRLEREEQMI